ncbi:ferrous iron transport protein B [Alkalithermobacter thermoalcaliphilus JW-YL-7 = DSM 7308]|uniref:Ferrous iron transport protein B n=1 Tax=Alkalithermobacter thermoalcaliphilus JW-YL-7 = DSM 7308 TaxID=1121328 RepID=A0A150FPZ0_CLOPD|nr:small GTP-binding protein [[Clostridium] paradoxum JW-YL-7 = DSM 7308]SHK85521.1 ferrous iron transport protein B [[Clostridium] paradoxum JW-YL-7 = DSM 7308]
MNCHNDRKGNKSSVEYEKKILLMGNPNVGKSVIFSKLTGMEVMTANYAGTTVSYTQGVLKSENQNAVLIDVPGIYSLEATSKAEEVAIDMLNENPDAIICVLDATNLDRNLNLALHLREYNIPTVYALNLTDVAKRQGIQINVEKLKELLQAPVIETVAVRNIGLNELTKKALEISKEDTKLFEGKLTKEERWDMAQQITQKVQTRVDHEPSFLEKLGDLTIQPFPGIPIALIVLSIALGIVVGGGKALRAAVLLPLVNNIIVPFIVSIVDRFVQPGVIYNILVGEFGVLVKGIEWPFALILPYVLLFYIVLSFLEDSGYLPRLGVLVDGILRKLGLPGGNIVPFIMGYGCAVPAILGTRASTSYKERLILTFLISLAVPCTAQTGAFFTLLGDRSIIALIFVYMISFISIIIAGVLLNKFIPGHSDPLLLEIPNLLMPNRQALLQKIWIRFKHFLFDAEVPMMIGIVLAALVAETGFLNIIGSAMQPLVEGWLGLPKEAGLALLLGIIRRELAVMPLLDMNLSITQVIVGSVVALFYLPCLSAFAMLIKEFKLKVALIMSLSTIIIALLFGGIVNNILGFIL